MAGPPLWRALSPPLIAALAAAAGATLPAGGAAASPVAKPPDDPLFKYQWHLRQIQILDAWRVSRGKGAVVAVIDTGVAYENRGVYRRAPDLAGTHFVQGWDFVDGDAHPDDEPPRDRPSHGTHLAGIIAQTTGNGIGAAGVAPAATIMPIRVLKRNVTGSAPAIARGLRYAADHGADVANLSLAGATDKKVLRDAVRYAVREGVTVVASAGNGGGPQVSFPAAYPSVIAVGAVTRRRSRAYFSNYGKALDLVAPAGDRELVAEGVQQGDGVLQQTLNRGPSTFCYCFMASTSAAAAEVSGVAALLVASGRAKSPAEVRRALVDGALDLGPRGRDARYGAGLLQAAASLERAAGGSASGSGSDGNGWRLAVLVLAALAVVAGLVRLILRRPVA
jgi:serine protease